MAAYMRRVIAHRNVYFLQTYCYSSYIPKTRFDIDLKQEYTDTPEYPPIHDLSYWGKKYKQRHDHFAKIRSKPTVEEKMMEMMNERITTYLLNELGWGYGSHELRKAITRTHVITGLPAVYDSLNVDALYEKVKPKFIQSALLAQEANADKEDAWSTLFLKSLNHIVHSHLSLDNPHLYNAEVCFKPRIVATWEHTGFPHRESVQKHWEKLSIEVRPSNEWFKYQVYPIMQVRNNLPLPEFLPSDHELCKGEVTQFAYTPKSVGERVRTMRFPVTNPGVWPGNPNTFSNLTIHSGSQLQLKRQRLLENSQDDETILGGGITAGFAALLGTAMLQGITIYDEMPYPLTTQVAFTYENNWWFFAYQMNACNFSRECSPGDRRNVAWVQPRQKLFESIENGEVKGWNDDVMKTLLKMYLLKPELRDGVNMSPYLGTTQLNKEEWDALLGRLKYKTADRKAPYIRRTPMWEKIYKIWNKAKID